MAKQFFLKVKKRGTKDLMLPHTLDQKLISIKHSTGDAFSTGGCKIESITQPSHNGLAWYATLTYNCGTDEASKRNASKHTFLGIVMIIVVQSNRQVDNDIANLDGKLACSG